jgi:hypothetical protein
MLSVAAKESERQAIVRNAIEAIPRTAYTTPRAAASGNG